MPVLAVLCAPVASGADTAGACRPSTWLHGVLLEAGPVVGHGGPSTAPVWLRTKRGTTIEACAVQKGCSIPAARMEELESGFRIAHFADLCPAMSTEVVLEIGREGFAPEKETVSFRTAPLPARTGKVRFGFGFCSEISQFGVAPVYGAIADERPDFAIFLGDNVYFIVADGSPEHFCATPTTGPEGGLEL